MVFDTVEAALDFGTSIINRIFPDPSKQADERLKLAELAQDGKLQELNARVELLRGQLEINKLESQHKSLFVAGWRPGVGWVCVVCLALAFIPKSIALTLFWGWQCVLLLSTYDASVFAITGEPLPTLPPFPELGITEVIGLLGSLLGMATLRSIDKAKKTQTDAL